MQLKVRSLLAARDYGPLALVGYGLLTVALTHPLAFRLRDRLLGDGEAWLFLWNMWWLRFSLLRGQSPFCTDYIAFPHGECTYLHSRALLPSILSVPLQGALSLLTISNVFAFTTFVLAGFGAYRLARYLGVGSLGAFLAGCAFSFSPYHFSQSLGHFNLINYQWLPFFFLSSLRGVRQGWTPHRVAAAALWLVATGLCDWYYFVFGICGLFIITLVFREACQPRWKQLIGSASVVLAAVIVLSPLIIPMIQMEKADFPGAIGRDVFRRPSVVLRSGSRFDVRQLVQSVKHQVDRGEAESGEFVPWSLLCLAVWAWFGLKRPWSTRSAVWIGVFFVLSLGPVLQLGGQQITGEAMPFSWFGTYRALDFLEALPGSTC